MDITEAQVKQYMWPHIDFGNNVKVCAKFLGELNHRHGEIVYVISHFTLAEPKSFKCMENSKEYKGTFRLLDAGLYREDWMAAALPIAKQLYETTTKEKNRE